MAEDIYEAIVQLRRTGGRGVLATIVQVRGSIPAYETAKLLVREDGSLLGTIGGGCVEAEVCEAARDVLAAEKSRRMVFHLNNDPGEDSGLICGGTLEIFLEPIVAPPTLFLFGAGHVSQAIAAVAGLAGFEVVVVDDRERFANRERFPQASAVYADDFETVCGKLNITSASYLVIVTRGHKGDMQILRWAVTTPAKYVGMIGSKRKVLTTFRELEKQAIAAERLQRVHAPIGLEIGALLPEEIAVAVVAELIAVRRGVVSRAHLSINHRGDTAAALGGHAPVASDEVFPEPPLISAHHD